MSIPVSTDTTKGGNEPSGNNTATAPTTTHNNVNFIWDSHCEFYQMILSAIFSVVSHNRFEKESKFNPDFLHCGSFPPFQSSIHPLLPHTTGHLAKWAKPAWHLLCYMVVSYTLRWKASIGFEPLPHCRIALQLRLELQPAHKGMITPLLVRLGTLVVNLRRHD